MMSSITFTPAMRFAAISTAVTRGTYVDIFSIETVLSPGFPKFVISAKADTQFMQAPFRLKIVFSTAGLPYPKGKIITNIVHDIQKLQSGECDFALAISLLIAQEGFQERIHDCAFIGTMGLDGSILEVRGVLAILKALRHQKKYVFVSNALTNYLLQYSLWKYMAIIPVDSILQAWQYINSSVDFSYYAIKPVQLNYGNMMSDSLEPEKQEDLTKESSVGNRLSLNSVSTEKLHITIANQESSVLDSSFGQIEARQQLLWSAVGAHHTFLYGPCGVGKTELAQSLISVLPPLDEEERLLRDIYREGYIFRECPEEKKYQQQKFQNSHNKEDKKFGKSDVYPELIKPVGKLTHSQVFGGKYPHYEPGFIHLASQGVLFLDECTYISATILDALRIFLDEQIQYPDKHIPQQMINFQLIMAANMCACGSAFPQKCPCTVSEKRKYRARLSYALLDRIDIHIPMLPIYPAQKSRISQGQGSDSALNSDSMSDPVHIKVIQDKVTVARERSYARWGVRIPNARIAKEIIRDKTYLSLDDQEFLHKLIRDYKYSLRSYMRLLALAWSIADFAADPTLTSEHITMAGELKETW